MILPHATAYNAVAEEAMSRISRALGGGNAAQALFDLNASIGAPRSLKELGMPESGIEQAVSLATKNPYYNPRARDRRRHPPPAPECVGGPET